MAKWLTDDKGFYLSPSKQKSVDAQAARRRKKHKTNKDKYYERKLHRYCPICNTELTKKNKILKEGKKFSEIMYACSECHHLWYSSETNKVWKGKRPKINRKVSNQQFKKELNEI